MYQRQLYVYVSLNKEKSLFSYRVMTIFHSTIKRCQICRFYSRKSLIINEKLNSRLKYYQEECSPTPYSIDHFVRLSQERSHLYNLVRSEIPIRISRVITQLPQYFPPELYEQRTAQFIQDYFEMSFKEIEALPLSINFTNLRLNEA